MHTAHQEKARIEFLDLMRVFAFISVLVGHKLFSYVTDFASDTTNHATLRWCADAIAALCLGGGAGVIVFFLTSGYIITHVLRSESTTEFLIKRFFRIYPLYITAVLTETVLATSVHGLPMPEASVLGPRLLLVGDFFGTPYALAGVEWTLRVEVLFYVFMAALKMLGVFGRSIILPLIFVAAAVGLGLLAPFPAFAGWSDGYLTIFAPYLFMGSVLYLIEHKLVNTKLALVAMGFMFVFSFHLLARIQPVWNSSHFPALAFLVFATAWSLRSHIRSGSAIRQISELTFAVYLFHNWLWDYIDMALKALGVTTLPQTLQILVVLFVFCYLMYLGIERPAARLGRVLIRASRPTK